MEQEIDEPFITKKNLIIFIISVGILDYILYNFYEIKDFIDTTFMAICDFIGETILTFIFYTIISIFIIIVVFVFTHAQNENNTQEYEDEYVVPTEFEGTDEEYWERYFEAFPELEGVLQE